MITASLVENLATSTSAHDVTGGIRAKLTGAPHRRRRHAFVIVQAATEHAERALAGRTHTHVATLILRAGSACGWAEIEHPRLPI